MAGFENGSVIGNLRIEQELGRGAFGRVYLARDTLIGRQVALKVVPGPGEDRDDVERNRALKEARAVGGLNSPHIVTLYGVHPPAEDNAWMFEMEYVKGGTLNDLLGRERSLPAERAAEIARGIATALRVAHEGGVVHGDVKPSNVLLHPDGTAKMADFGLARILGDVSLSLSATGELVGTPVYMSPEVVMGERPTVASDIWSFGVVLYRMLAGRLPFEAGNLNSLFFGIQNTQPVPLDEIVPLDLAELAHHCLMKVPEDRPRSSEELVARLASTRREPSIDPAPTTARLRVRGRIVGRGKELKHLAERVTAAEKGEGSVVLLSGPAGVGKTTLAHQVGALAQSRGFRWIESAVMPLEGVLRPLLESLRDVLETEEIADRDSGIFGSAATQVRKLLDEKPGPRLENQAQTVWVLEQLLKGLAKTHRVAVLLEDAQHADAEDVRLLKLLARYLPQSGILFLVTHRTGDRERAGDVHELAALEQVEHIPVPPLKREDAYRLLEDQAEGARIAPEIAERILSTSQGNPFFVVELFRHLRDTGAIVRGNGSLRAAPSFDATSLPSRFRDLVAYRLERLPEEDRTLLDMAAVDGVTFDGEAVASVLEKPMLAVLRSLQQIYREHGIIVPSRTGYRFANAVFQEVIYTDLAPELRRAIHLQLAGHLEKRAAVSPERQGHHWKRGGEPEKARPHLLRAAREAVNRQEFLRVIRCAERAGLTAEQDDPSLLLEDPDAVFALASSLQNVGKGAQATSLLDNLIEAAGTGGKDEVRLKAVVRRAVIDLFSSGHASIDEPQLKKASRDLPPCMEQGRARMILGIAAKYRSDLEEARRWFLSADEVYQSMGLDARHASALHALGSVELRAGNLRRAEALYADAARIAAHAGQRVDVAASLVNGAISALRRGAIEGLATKVRESVRIFTLEGARNNASHAGVILADLLYAAGDLRRAEETTDWVLRTLIEIGYLPGLISAHLQKAHLAAVRGDLEQGFLHLERSRTAAKKTGDHGHQVALAGFEALVQCWKGDLAAATRAAKSCLELAAQQEPGAPETGTALYLAESVLYGLPPEVTVEVEVLLDRAETDANVLRKILAGVRAWADPDGAPEPILEAADALRGPTMGERRAVMRILGAWLAADGHRRAGRTADADEEAARASKQARALGHVWLQEKPV